MCAILLQDIPPDKHVEKLLVGNKCDLESERVIPYETVQKVSSASCDLVGYHGTNTDGRGREPQFY